MDDMKLIVKILGLIREQEKEGVYNTIVFSEECLKCPQRQIDTLALKLKKAGYIDGLLTTEDINNCKNMLLWQHSKPEITLSGIEYMNENSAFRKAKEQLKELGITSATAMASNLLTRFINGV